jgi:hypothetical protein
MGGGRGDVSRLGMHAMQAGWLVLLERVVEHHQLHTASQSVHPSENHTPTSARRSSVVDMALLPHTL